MSPGFAETMELKEMIHLNSRVKAGFLRCLEASLLLFFLLLASLGFGLVGGGGGGRFWPVLGLWVFRSGRPFFLGVVWEWMASGIRAHRGLFVFFL